MLDQALLFLLIVASLGVGGVLGLLSLVCVAVGIAREDMG